MRICRRTREAVAHWGQAQGPSAVLMWCLEVPQGLTQCRSSLFNTRTTSWSRLVFRLGKGPGLPVDLGIPGGPSGTDGSGARSTS